MEDGDNNEQQRRGSELPMNLPCGLDQTASRPYPRRIEDVTHFRTDDSDVEQPISALRGEHERAVGIYSSPRILCRLCRPTQRRHISLLLAMYAVFMFGVGLLAALIIQHFTWGQLN